MTMDARIGLFGVFWRAVVLAVLAALLIIFDPLARLELPDSETPLPVSRPS
jgi:hypothetical protein